MAVQYERACKRVHIFSRFLIRLNIFSMYDEFSRNKNEKKKTAAKYDTDLDTLRFSFDLVMKYAG